MTTKLFDDFALVISIIGDKQVRRLIYKLESKKLELIKQLQDIENELAFFRVNRGMDNLLRVNEFLKEHNMNITHTDTTIKIEWNYNGYTVKYVFIYNKDTNMFDMYYVNHITKTTLYKTLDKYTVMRKIDSIIDHAKTFDRHMKDLIILNEDKDDYDWSEHFIDNPEW